ncbi:hypothetical protein QP986_01360 [Corynebacterium striatum]|uniref:hypothetical protein n=1 Tax=Corynebacterium striatum TaxID=43770 RepID=UPI001661F144|nr:hypothetical protein [Corynebacterium striatum]MDK8842735.1 hypothetical protein [Corynebacterium striatum]
MKDIKINRLITLLLGIAPATGEVMRLPALHIGMWEVPLVVASALIVMVTLW